MLSSNTDEKSVPSAVKTADLEKNGHQDDNGCEQTSHGGKSSSTMEESDATPPSISYRRTMEEKLLRTRAQNTEASLGEPYDTVSYELVDTPIWHRRQMAMANEQDYDERSWFYHFFLDRGYKDPIEAFYREMRWVSRFTLVVLGIVMSGIGYILSFASEQLILHKLEFVKSHALTFGSGFAYLTGLNVLFSLLAFAPVALRPVSGGSGIAEAKAVLNGIVIPRCTDLLTAICKAISVIFASAASLPVGLEGPMIFIGLSLGENAHRFIPSKYVHLHTNRERRDLAAVGTSAGVSAAFYAPVAGVLFSLEEGCSFWSTKLSWKCFACSCITVIASYFWSEIRNGLDGNLNVEFLAKFNGVDGQMQDFKQPTFHLLDYFVFGLFGVVGGVAGACFIELNRAFAIWRRRLALSILWKCIEVVLLTVIMSALIWWLPLAMSTCSDFTDVKADQRFFRQFNCPDGEYNHLATLFLNPPSPVGINLLFWEERSVFSASSCVVAGTVYFVMLLVLFGASLGMGIFIPLLYIGACFGRAIAIWVGADVATYAIVGSCAMLAGVLRVLISITALMMQTTGLPYFVTPFMIVTIIGRIVGKFCFGRGGIYEVILELKGIPFLDEGPPELVKHSGLRASSIMSPPPLVTLRPQMRVDDLITTLKDHSHLDFPVVDPLHESDLVGLITREHIMVLLNHREAFHDDSSRYESAIDFDASSSKDLTYDELVGTPRSHDLDAIEALLTEEDVLQYVDLLPYVQIAPLAFDEDGSAERAYELFRTIGLRNLVVVGAESKPVGTITRADLKVLEKLGFDERTLPRRRRTMGVYNSIS